MQQLEWGYNAVRDLLEPLFAQPQLLLIFQIGLDLLLVLSLLIFMLKREKSVVSISGGEELMESLERIIEETRTIAGEFDANLRERQVLIQQIMAKLDVRIEESGKMIHEMRALQQNNRHYQIAEAAPSQSLDPHDVLRLARAGHSAESIARKLKKPLGEVELILKLKRMTDG